jgi:hypothetical protein
VSAFACAVFGAAGSTELSPQDFAYGMQVVGTGNAVAYWISLPLAVYQKMVRADLGDVRVFNERGEVVPYALERPRTETLVRHPAKPLPVFPLQDDSDAALDAVRVTIESGQAAVSFQTQGSDSQSAVGASDRTSRYIVDGRALDVPVSALLLDWPDDAQEFAGRLKVEAGDTLGSWRTVADGAPIADLRANGEHLIERRVEVPATKAKFWRLSWVGTAAPFAVTAVSGEPARDHIDVERSNLTVSGRPAADKRGEFEFDLGARLPIDRLNIELPEPNTVVEIELFSRARPSDAWRFIERRGFYRIRSGGTGDSAELRNGPVPIGLISNRYWLVRADARGGGLGSGSPRLSAGWISHEVVFLARGAGPFLLAYGSGAATPAASSLEAVPKNVAIVQASLASEHVLGGESRLAPPPAPFPWKSVVLWAALVAGVALLAWMAYRLSKDLR